MQCFAKSNFSNKQLNFNKIKCLNIFFLVFGKKNFFKWNKKNSVSYRRLQHAQENTVFKDLSVTYPYGIIWKICPDHQKYYLFYQNGNSSKHLKN